MTDRWTLVRRSRSQDDTTIATVRLDGDRLTGDVNSTERAEELQQLVAPALPDAELLDIDARPFRLPAGARSDELDEPVEPVDPALRAALAEHMATMEERWLDESIPALGGRTPREAAADPVGREELIRLLASFPPAAERRHRRRHEPRPAAGRCSASDEVPGRSTEQHRDSRQQVSRTRDHGPASGVRSVATSAAANRSVRSSSSAYVNRNGRPLPVGRAAARLPWAR